MLHKKGFTLIELLVVIAIITILAATVAPRVSNWISRGRMARAASEIRNADLAIVKMLADADRKSVGQFFVRMEGSGVPADVPLTFPRAMQALMATRDIYKMYTQMFYELLRRGKDAQFVVDPSHPLANQANFDMSNELNIMPPYYKLDDNVKKKLGTSYIDIGNDPWGNPYVFFPGPINKTGLVGFRGYRGEGWVYNAKKDSLDREMRGNPPLDEVLPNVPLDPASVPGCPQGYPAPRDLPVYIYSWGEDRTQGQYIGILNAVTLNHILSADGTYSYVGGGDDINNWDSTSGWGELY